MTIVWKCERHNRLLDETLNYSETKIVPYCSHCEAEAELALIKMNKTAEYCQELIKRKSFKKKIIFILPAYFIGILFLFMGIGLIKFTILDLSFSGFDCVLKILGIFSGLLLCFFGGFILNAIHVYQKGPAKSVLPTKEMLLQAKSDLIHSQQAKVEKYKKQLNLQYKNQEIKNFLMEDIDNMSGFDFEEYVAELLKKLGYSETNLTPKSGDSGADIIATDLGGKKVAVQCKRYGKHNRVGIDAIQQIYLAMRIYDCHHAMVITTSFLSKQALQAAEKSDVIVWDRKKLKEKVVHLNKESWNDYLLNYYIDPTNKVESYIAGKVSLGNPIKMTF